MSEKKLKPTDVENTSESKPEPFDKFLVRDFHKNFEDLSLKKTFETYAGPNFGLTSGAHRFFSHSPGQKPNTDPSNNITSNIQKKKS